MKTFCIILLWIINLFSSQVNFYEKSDSEIVNFNISMTEPIVKLNNEIYIDLAIKNLSDKSILIPSQIYFGYESDVDSDVIFEVVKISNKVTTKITPSADYTYPEIIVFGKQYVEIKKLEVKKMKFRLSSFYDLKRGSFKVRAKFVMPATNKLKKKNIYSNWTSFQVV